MVGSAGGDGAAWTSGDATGGDGAGSTTVLTTGASTLSTKTKLPLARSCEPNAEGSAAADCSFEARTVAALALATAKVATWLGLGLG